MADLLRQQLAHVRRELRDASLGLGRFGVPALFRLEADPLVVTDRAERGDELGERQVAFAKEAGGVLLFLGDGVLDVHVLHVALQLLPRLARRFAAAVGVVRRLEAAGPGGWSPGA